MSLGRDSKVSLKNYLGSRDLGSMDDFGARDVNSGVICFFTEQSCTPSP